MKRMKIKTMSRALLIVLALSVAIQAGYSLVSIVQAQTVVSSGGTSTDIETKYKQLLVTLDVHEKFKQEIERLIMAGHRLQDLLIAYDFLYQNFGKMQDLESLIKQKEAGKPWEALFTAYNTSHTEFVPRAFDPDYLEGLMKMPGFTSDDVMMADRVSFVSGKPVKDLIAAKLESQRNWKDVTAELDILHGTSTLPRVQITAQQLSKFAKPGAFTEEQVAEAFVLAQKIGKSPETVIEKMKTGLTEEAIMADGYMEKYN